MRRMSTTSRGCFLILMTVALVAFLSPDVLAQGTRQNDRVRGHDQDQIRDRDRLADCDPVVTPLAADQDRDRLRTRDRLRDCDPDVLMFRPAFGASQDQYRQEIRNQYRYQGILPPESRVILGLHRLFGLF